MPLPITILIGCAVSDLHVVVEQDDAITSPFGPSQNESRSEKPDAGAQRAIPLFRFTQIVYSVVIELVLL